MHYKGQTTPPAFLWRLTKTEHIHVHPVVDGDLGGHVLYGRKCWCVPLSDDAGLIVLHNQVRA